jgi:hypothetical protein
MLAFGDLSFVNDALSFILVQLVDGIVYKLLAYIYNIYVALTKLDLFAAGTAGETIYENFTKTIYTTIAIVMIFIFAYRLLMYIMDPDGSYMPTLKTSKFIKGIVISVIFVIVAPVIFRYMSIFQFHVVSDNTIPKIVLGEDSGVDFINPGKQLSMLTLMSFYHPYDYTYSDFVSSDSKSCDDIGSGLGSDKLTDQWTNDMKQWCNADDFKVSYITSDKDIRKAIGDNVEYFWLICTICGGLVIYFMLSYAISVGTRAIKLGVLEMIAPIPILLRMFDDKTKFFDPWFNEIKKTYLELFIRIGMISLVIKLCTLVPEFIGLILG